MIRCHLVCAHSTYSFWKCRYNHWSSYADCRICCSFTLVCLNTCDRLWYRCNTFLISFPSFSSFTLFNFVMFVLIVTQIKPCFTHTLLEFALSTPSSIRLKCSFHFTRQMPNQNRYHFVSNSILHWESPCLCIPYWIYRRGP